MNFTSINYFLKQTAPKIYFPVNVLFLKTTLLNIYFNTKNNSKLNNSFWRKAQEKNIELFITHC